MAAFADDGINQNQRIRGTESTMDAVMKLAEGNPGAISVLAKLVQGEWHGIPGLLLMLYLDSMGIYGSNIWVLFKDCCGQDMGKVEAVLRGWQLGRLNLQTIHTHLSTWTPFENLPTVDEMLATVGD